jgi:hypothetical protein
MSLICQNRCQMLDEEAVMDGGFIHLKTYHREGLFFRDEVRPIFH